MYLESGVALAGEDAKHRPCQLAYDAVAACDYGQVGAWTSRTQRSQIPRCAEGCEMHTRSVSCAVSQGGALALNHHRS